MESLFRSFVWLLSILLLATPVLGTDYVATATLITNPSTTPGQASKSFVVGTITFTQKSGDSKVSIEGQLIVDSPFPLQNSTVGFHIHTTSNFSDGCNSAGSHYNPDHKNHGGPTDSERHVGDLGNVIFDQTSRTANVKLTDNVISLTGSRSVIGRSLVLHVDTDDLGKGGHNDSLTTGHAGARYACGAIVLASDFQTSSAESVLVAGSRMAIVSLVALFAYAFRM